MYVDDIENASVQVGGVMKQLTAVGRVARPTTPKGTRRGRALFLAVQRLLPASLCHAQIKRPFHPLSDLLVLGLFLAASFLLNSCGSSTFFAFPALEPTWP